MTNYLQIARFSNFFPKKTIEKFCDPTKMEYTIQWSLLAIPLQNSGHFVNYPSGYNRIKFRQSSN